MLKNLAVIVLVPIMSGVAYAEHPDWTVRVTCDANSRQARVELTLCDAGDGACTQPPAEVSNDVRSVSAPATASSALFTPVRVGDGQVSMIGFSPAEFACRAPPKHDPVASGAQSEPSVYIRVERFPSNWNPEGRCGAAPDQVKVLVQTGTGQLNLGAPAQEILMVGDCGWGDPGPLASAVIDIDTGAITTTLFSPEP